MIEFIYNIDRGLDNKCGIYRISSDKHTDRIYIGSSVGLRKRFKDHISDLRGNRHGNQRLQNFYNKYKDTDFKIYFDLMEVCEKSERFEREDYYLTELRPFYNICLTSTGRKLGIPMPEEIRKKISETHKELYRRGILVPNELPLVETKCPLCGKSFKAKKRKTKKLQKYCSMKCKHKGQVFAISRRIVQLDLSNNFIGEWASAAEAERSLNVESGTIGDCCRGKIQTAYKFKWVFFDEYNKEKWIKCETIPFLSAICN